MGNFKIKPVGIDKVNITKQVSVRLYGVSWRFGTSRTVKNDRESIESAKLYINDYINQRTNWSLSQLVDAYPERYQRALDRKTGERAVLTYKQAVSDLTPYLRENVSSNTLYAHTRALERFGRLYGLNGLDVTLLTAEEVNRLLLKHHKSLNTTSSATFDSSLAAFRWLFKYLYANGYIPSDPLLLYKMERPSIPRDAVDKGERRFYDAHELDFIYKCLDDSRHLAPVYRDSSDLPLKDKDGDYKYYKAHYKVRRVLQLMIDTGMRSGEVLTVKKSHLNGVVLLSNDIDFSGKLWANLEGWYDELTLQEPWESILEAVKVGELIDNLPHVYPRFARLSSGEKALVTNTARFMAKYDDPDLLKWSDFGWRNYLHGDRRLSRRNRGTIGISDLFTLPGDIFWLADALPMFDSSLVVTSTITKDVDDKGKVYVKAKDGAKTKAGSSRIVPLNKRARDTIVKTWRDILALEQSEPGLIEELFLNPLGKLYEPTSITNAWTKLVKKMKKERDDLPVLTPHGLRHSFITLKAQQAQGMGDLVRLRDQVGHGSITTTLDIYAQRAKGSVDASKSDL